MAGRVYFSDCLITQLTIYHNQDKSTCFPMHLGEPLTPNLDDMGHKLFHNSQELLTCQYFKNSMWLLVKWRFQLPTILIH